MHTDTKTTMKTLAEFIGRSQRHCVTELLKGEEGTYFAATLATLAATVAAMPTTYDQEGQGTNATAHLHYFRGGADWYITEKDINTDGAGQLQAFGLVNLGDGPEFGYISIPDILAAGAELDFHFTPITLAEIAARH